MQLSTCQASGRKRSNVFYESLCFCTGIYFEGYSPDPELKDEWWHSPALCEQQKLTDMCQLVKKEVPLVSAAFAGSFLITLSLVRHTCTYSCCSCRYLTYRIKIYRI